MAKNCYHILSTQKWSSFHQNYRDIFCFEVKQQIQNYKRYNTYSKNLLSNRCSVQKLLETNTALWFRTLTYYFKTFSENAIIMNLHRKKLSTIPLSTGEKCWEGFTSVLDCSFFVMKV